MALARDTDGSVPLSRIESAWPSIDQRERCLAGLLADGLLVEVRSEPGGVVAYALPS
jgi:A/G-specific adenine glycosylase